MNKEESINNMRFSVDKIRDEFSDILHDLRKELCIIQTFLDREDVTMQVSDENETWIIDDYGKLLEYAEKYFNKQFLEDIERFHNG